MEKALLITPTLLNSWDYLPKAYDVEKAKDEFFLKLKREKTPMNKYMKKGIEFEKECVEGKIAGISNRISGGAFQVKGSKRIRVDGQEYVLYGIADALKAGVIYDIKWNKRYKHGKYLNSFQHPVYFHIFPEATKFVYLIGQPVGKERAEQLGQDYEIYEEVYYREDIPDLEMQIKNFIGWLKDNDLYEIYEKHWEAY